LGVLPWRHCAGAPPRPELAPPDFSSPRLAAKSFYGAVESGDIATVRASMLAADDAQQKLVDAFTDVIAASLQMGSAARDKFGAAGDSLGTTVIPKEEAARIDKAEEKIDGDDATLSVPGRPVPMKFRRVDNAWRLIVTDFAGAKPDNIAAQTQLLQQLARILNQTSADISAGKFTAPEQAQAAFQDQMNAALIQIAGPATHPATAPAR
jgi:hypothetical protein